MRRIRFIFAVLVAVTVAGGDATAEAREMGLAIGDNQFVIKGEAPATVDLEVEYASTTTREVPFELEFGLGL